MITDLEKMFLENTSLLDLSACWYVFHGTSTQKISKTISVNFFDNNRHKIFEEPKSIIDLYHKEKPLEFIDYDYPENSWYLAWKELKTKYEFFEHYEYLNFHFTMSYFSDMSQLHYLFKIQFKVDVENQTIMDQPHLGHIPQSNDIVSKLVFDDVEHLTQILRRKSIPFVQSLYNKYMLE
jgi:hypothetical protein